MEEFRKLGLGKQLVETLSEHGFVKPTPIQEKAIPLTSQGIDVIGQAATGSGKTLAFGSVMIENIQRNEGIQGLVLTPTRELAEQVASSIRKFAKGYSLQIEDIYGGVSIEPQIRKLEKAEIVVGTPGRILDHLERRTLNLGRVKFLVLDEADRMADMGFLPDVEKIINFCPRKKQMLLFSATMSQDINYISKKYMSHPRTVSVESYVDPAKLKQVFYDTPTNEKFSLLVHLLKSENSKLIMVFCNTRRNAEIVSENLMRFGIRTLSIHGGLNQAKRSRALGDFNMGKTNVLICTDVAARGLHIDSVSHVYNYDIPKTATEYIHRIGRTARAGKEGKTISFVTSKDYESFRRVLDDPAIRIEQEQLPEFERLKPRFKQEIETRGRYGERGGSDRGFDRRRGFSKPRRFNSEYRRDSRPRQDSRGNRDRPMRSSGRFDRPRRDSHSRHGQEGRRSFSRQKSFGRR